MANLLKFVTQPNNAVKGYTLQGSSASQDSLTDNDGIQVGVYDSTGLILQTADTTSVTIAFGTNPTSGSVLGGTLTKPVIQGIASFTDLSVSLAGTGYTLTATDGGYTSATTNAFNAADVYRVNPFEIDGTITATGIANAIGPYRYRGGRTMDSVRVSANSTNITDVCSIIILEPNTVPSANVDEALIVSNYTPASGLTCPFSFTIDRHQMGGQVDVYVFATTATGTIKVKIQRVP